MDFYNERDYDCHFIIKELANKLEGEFNYLRENTEKCKNFSVPFFKEIKRIVKSGKEIAYLINYNLLIAQDL